MGQPDATHVYLLVYLVFMQTKAEIYVGGYEALHYILKSLVFMRSSSALSLLTRPYNTPEAEVKPHIDYFVQMFLENINNLIEAGYLTRARRAILIDWKVNIHIIKFDFFSVFVYKYLSCLTFLMCSVDVLGILVVSPEKCYSKSSLYTEL